MAAAMLVLVLPKSLVISGLHSTIAENRTLGHIILIKSESQPPFTVTYLVCTIAGFKRSNDILFLATFPQMPRGRISRTIHATKLDLMNIIPQWFNGCRDLHDSLLSVCYFYNYCCFIPQMPGICVFQKNQI
jgi:hypothetical protein